MPANYIKPVLGETLLVKLGDGAEPEVFTAANTINTTRGVTISVSTESDELVDLNNMSAPAQTIRRARATDIKIDGSGMMHADDTFTWLEWAHTGEIKNVQMTDGKWLIAGPMILTSFQIQGDRLKSGTNQVTIEQAGACTITEITP